MLQKSIVCYRTPLEIMPVGENLFCGTIQILQEHMNICWRRYVFQTTVNRTLETIAKDHEHVLADRRWTIHNVYEIVGQSCRTVNAFCLRIWMYDLFLRYLCQDCLVTNRRSTIFISVWNSNKKSAMKPKFISNIITDDESWLYIYDPEICLLYTSCYWYNLETLLVLRHSCDELWNCKVSYPG